MSVAGCVRYLQGVLANDSEVILIRHHQLVLIVNLDSGITLLECHLATVSPSWILYSAVSLIFVDLSFGL